MKVLACHLSLYIEDLEAPKFNVCKNITERTDPGMATALVIWTGPVATDNSGIDPNITCEPSSGYNFSIGTNNVTCNATDNNGNTATCTFDVTIIGTLKHLQDYLYNFYSAIIGGVCFVRYSLA